MLKRVPIIAANWKMHKTEAEAESFIDILKAELPHPLVKILIAPPFTALSKAYATTQGSPVMIGAQNMHEADEGAFTCEISIGLGFFAYFFNNTDNFMS